MSSKNWMVIRLMLLMMALAGGCSSTPKESSSRKAEIEASRAAILAELEQYYADLSARKWSAFASHFWPGATITTVWQPPTETTERVIVTSVPDFVAQAPQGPGSKPIFEERMTSCEVRVHGNLAQAWATYFARFGEPGAVAEWSGVDAFTLMEHGGRWKIIALGFASDQ